MAFHACAVDAVPLSEWHSMPVLWMLYHAQSGIPCLCCGCCTFPCVERSTCCKAQSHIHVCIAHFGTADLFGSRLKRGVRPWPCVELVNSLRFFHRTRAIPWIALRPYLHIPLHAWAAIDITHAGVKAESARHLQVVLLCFSLDIA